MQRSFALGIIRANWAAIKGLKGDDALCEALRFIKDGIGKKYEDKIVKDCLKAVRAEMTIIEKKEEEDRLIALRLENARIARLARILR